MGLGSYWGEVIEVLRQIIPIYDKVNSYISLGKDKEHRIRGITNRVQPGNHILDAGSGFGNMSKTAEKICNGNLTITLYDPLVPMLKNTSMYFARTPDMSCGVFEHIPFKEEQFDAVLCGYSLRDAINLRIAISEIHRVLKKGGRFVIVDLGKPDNPGSRAGVSLYLRVMLPIIAFTVGGKLGLKFGTRLRFPRMIERYVIPDKAGSKSFNLTRKSRNQNRWFIRNIVEEARPDPQKQLLGEKLIHRFLRSTQIYSKPTSQSCLSFNLCNLRNLRTNLSHSRFLIGTPYFNLNTKDPKPFHREGAKVAKEILETLY